MSAQRKAARRREIEAVREHARAAYAVGVKRENCPYKYSDRYQWQNEWDRCHMEANPPMPIREAIGIARNAAHSSNGQRDHVLSQEEARAISMVCAALEDHERISF